MPVLYDCNQLIGDQLEEIDYLRALLREGLMSMGEYERGEWRMRVRSFLERDNGSNG